MRLAPLAAAAFAMACAQTASSAPRGAATSAQDTAVIRALPRIAEAAERFAANAQQVMGLETLRQRMIHRASAHKEQKRDAALSPAAAQYSVRQIVSYYAFTTLRGSPAIHEIRQVLTVDKETEAKDDDGRKFLRNALLSYDDDAKKKMRQQFEAEGLSGVATDLGQMVLLFDKSGQKNFVFEYDREENIGVARTMVIRYSQKSGPEGVRINDRGKETKGKLTGWIWVRLPDCFPMRITMITSRHDRKLEIRDEAEVDYGEGARGSLLPFAAFHRRYENDILAAEDDFRYSNWQSLK